MVVPFAILEYTVTRVLPTAVTRYRYRVNGPCWQLCARYDKTGLRQKKNVLR